MEKPIVKIKLLPGGKMPEKKSKGAAAYDCYARLYRRTYEVRKDGTEREIWVEKAESVNDKTPVLIPLGFALELPEGYHAEIYPRSSVGLKTKIRVPNSIGIIDSDYRGEVNLICETKEGSEWVSNGQRIAQMLIVKDSEVELKLSDELSETERGEGGFGSTGKR